MFSKELKNNAGCPKCGSRKLKIEHSYTSNIEFSVKASCCCGAGKEFAYIQEYESVVDKKDIFHLDENYNIVNHEVGHENVIEQIPLDCEVQCEVCTEWDWNCDIELFKTPTEWVEGDLQKHTARCEECNEILDEVMLLINRTGRLFPDNFQG